MSAPRYSVIINGRARTYHGSPDEVLAAIRVVETNVHSNVERAIREIAPGMSVSYNGYARGKDYAWYVGRDS